MLQRTGGPFSQELIDVLQMMMPWMHLNGDWNNTIRQLFNTGRREEVHHGDRARDDEDDGSWFELAICV